MPDLNDFHAFNSTSLGESSGNGACLGSGTTWILAIIAVLWVIGKVFG